MERLIYNEWTVSGKVIYLKEFEYNEFALSVKLEASSKRKGCDSSQRLEFTCLFEADTYEEAKKKGFDKFKYVTLGGHIESWVKHGRDGDRPKIRFVCDDILEVC